MSDKEMLLIRALENASNENVRATLLAIYIQECGPVSSEAGEKIKQMMRG